MGSESNPFEFQPQIRTHGSSITSWLIAAIVGGVILFAAIWMIKNADQFGRYAGGAKVLDSDEELVREYNADPKSADNDYKDRLVRIPGICSEPKPTASPPWGPKDVHEGFEIQMGRSVAQFAGIEWRVSCFLPDRDKTLGASLGKIQSGDYVTIEGICKGKFDKQVCLVECRVIEHRKP